MEPSHRYGIAGMLIAHIVCCGGLVLAATGAVSFAGLASWLVGGGLFWLAAAGLAVIGIYLWRRSARLNDDSIREGRARHPVHSQPK